MALAFVIWNLAQGPWCDPTSWLQGHAAWHLLCALAAYLLFRLYASERVTDPLRSVAVGHDRPHRWIGDARVPRFWP